MKKVLLLLLSLAVLVPAAEARNRKKKRVAEAVPCTPARMPVRNLIYMIGDGMGLSHMAMLQIEQGYDSPVALSRAQNVALAKTYSANNRVTDSAAAGTALATGHKTDNGMLGMTPDSVEVRSIIARAAAEGRPTGEVVTCYLHHATPAAFYAHVPRRDMSLEIARQFADSGIDVAFGGGRTCFSEKGADGLSAVDRVREKGYEVLTDLDELERVGADGRVLGLFADGHMPAAAADRGDYLPKAVTKALELLDAKSAACGEGFVLMVEGSLIDTESHANNGAGVLREMEDFDAAVAVAMAYADAHPGTLVVVTADHETGGLTMPSGNADFTRSESGVDYRFSTGGHSGILVPVYLYGAGAERVNGVIENTELSNRLAEALGLK